MTDPYEMIASISNLERELQDLGWRPVEMIDETSGLPFTRWFPPVTPDTPLSTRNYEPTDDTGGEIP